MNKQKLLKKILAGSKNIQFDGMVSLVQAFGFYLARTRGSHHVFVHPGINALVNLQNVNGQAKQYQIKQFLTLVEKYSLNLKDES